METALFTNFSDKEFEGFWDGKGKKFQPGDSVYMPDYLARHFAKHLVNREILKFPKGETMTSPKRPEDFPVFVKLFAQAYKKDKTEDVGSPGDDLDTLIDTTNKNREKQNSELKKEASKTAGPNEPQTVLPPDFNEEDQEGEGSFEGKPDDNK